MAAPDDPLVEMGSKFAVGVAVETFKECLKGIRGVAGWIKSKSKEYDPLDRAAKSYVEGFEERYNCIRVFGMNKSIPLTDIYIRANILENLWC